MKASIGARHARHDPRSELPVAAYPAMASTHIGAVARRKLLVQLHVAEQTRPRIAPFEKVMTQDPVFGKTARQGTFEGIDVVDALADEGSFAEHVLVDVGNDARVWIDTRLAPEEARVSRPVGAGQ